MKLLSFGASQAKQYVTVSGKNCDDVSMDDSQLRDWCSEVRNGLAERSFLNCFSDMEFLLDQIGVIPTLDIRHLGQATKWVTADRSAVSFRLDVDAGIWSMSALAEAFAKRNIPAHFFILHTAAYYGVFSSDGKFVRQPGFQSYLAELVDTGQEIGIHNDALGVFERGINGFDALKTEIRWLKQAGARVRASSAHNSALIYGAENFEIFRGLTKRKQKKIIIGGNEVPLGRMWSRLHGLRFEANHAQLRYTVDEKALSSYMALRGKDLFRDPVWQRRHFLENPLFVSAYDTDIWLAGQNSWFIASRAKDKLEFPVSHDGVVDYLQQSRGERIVLNIHPDYIDY